MKGSRLEILKRKLKSEKALDNAVHLFRSCVAYGSMWVSTLEAEGFNSIFEQRNPFGNRNY
jgi:hypothetical protein